MDIVNPPTVNFRFVEVNNVRAGGGGPTRAGGVFSLLNNSTTGNIVFDGTVQIPFQFSPLLGIAGLSAIFATKKKLQKAK